MVRSHPPSCPLFHLFVFWIEIVGLQPLHHQKENPAPHSHIFVLPKRKPGTTQPYICATKKKTRLHTAGLPRLGWERYIFEAFLINLLVASVGLYDRVLIWFQMIGIILIY